MIFYSRQKRGDLRPLRSGQQVAIIGGGPAGTSCAIALRRQAEALGRDIKVALFEPKDFRVEANVCVGVLSPPFGKLMARLGLSLPEGIVQRRIGKYVLHTDGEALCLREAEDADETTLAVDRADLDFFMLESARAAGVEIRPQLVVDLRFGPDGVLVIGERGDVLSCDVVVGAFGLTGEGLRAFEAHTSYQRPGVMRSLLTDIPVSETEIDARVGDAIHALLLAAWPGVEFAALTPKRDHVTVNVAGPAIEERDLDASLAHFQRIGLLPERLPAAKRFYNVFPSSPAHNIYRDRAVTIGNTSGLLRPLKGKGINAGLQTGMRAARVILEAGVSREAFDYFYEACKDITSDYYYGLLLRSLYRLTRRLRYLDAIIGLARQDRVLYRSFRTMVSGEGSYRDVVYGLLRPALWWRVLGAVARCERSRRFGKKRLDALSPGQKT